MSKAKKAILITFIVLLVLAVLILGIIWCILIRAEDPTETNITYDMLSTVMEDDIVYLSDEFLTVNNLERRILRKEIGKEEVWIYYDRNKLGYLSDISSRVENLSGCLYILNSKANSEEIPVNIDVGFSTSKDKSKYHKYKQEYNGYKYCTSNVGDEYTYFVKTTPRKGATCTMTLTIRIKPDVASKYTEEQKNARIEQIFKSAVDNIVYYDELRAS